MNGALMAAEIAEQPDVLAGLIARRRELASRVRGVLPSALAGIVLIARGSSDHAAIYGRYLLEADSLRRRSSVQHHATECTRSKKGVHDD